MQTYQTFNLFTGKTTFVEGEGEINAGIREYANQYGVSAALATKLVSTPIAIYIVGADDDRQVIAVQRGQF